LLKKPYNKKLESGETVRVGFWFLKKLQSNWNSSAVLLRLSTRIKLCISEALQLISVGHQIHCSTKPHAW